MARWNVEKQGYPWSHLYDVSDGDWIEVIGVRSEGALRASASKWGKRYGGRVRIREVELGLYVVRLTKRPARDPRGAYGVLDRMKPGEDVVIAWPGGSAQTGNRAAHAAVARHLRGKRYLTHPTADGLHVHLSARTDLPPSS